MARIIAGGTARPAVWRSILAAALALVMLLTSPASAQAAWSTEEEVVTASATSGILAVKLSGFEGPLAASYSSGALAVAAPVAVTNTGTVPAPYTLTFGAGVETALATSAGVWVWPADSTATCTTPPANLAAKNWTTIGAVTGTLAPSASASYCVRSSVTQAQRFSLVRTDPMPTATVTAKLVATQGNWKTSPPVQTAVQSVANTLTPTGLSGSITADGSIALAWTAPADSAAITQYRIYRSDVADAGVLKTVPKSQTSYTDPYAGLSVSTLYTYTIEAIDSATPVNESPRSTSVGVTSKARDSSSWYKVVNAGTGLCVDVGRSNPSNNTPLISTACNGGSNQAWQFATDGRVALKGSDTLHWVNESNSAQLGKKLDKNAIWSAGAAGNGTFTLAQSGMCLSAPGGGSAGLTLANCVPGSASQEFRLTKVG